MTFRHVRNFRGFFSDYYLGSVFGRGAGRGRRRQLSDRQTDQAYARFRRLRERAEGRVPDAAACREKFLRPFLGEVLRFHLGAGENRIHGLFVSAEAEAAQGPPLALAYCATWDEDVEAGRGAAQPMRRMEQALASHRLRYGIIATGERLRLVRAQGEGPRGAYLEADLAGLAEGEDPESFAVVFRLFSASGFIPDAEGKAPIDEVERESRAHAERVSEDLQRAVFKAAESLVAGLIRDSVARGERASPLDLTDTKLRLYRDAALTALYRILFILYAEARDPHLDEHRVYRDSYSAQGLLEDILQDPGREWPGNRCSLYKRLLALFRIYDHGLPPIKPWECIPPRGGELFSATTEVGRILDRARLPDETVARLMLDLATSAPRSGVGRERVSFRELDIESLGAVYEGLLDHEPRVARETTLEVRIQGRTYALSPLEVVRLCEKKSLRLGEDHPRLTAGTAAERLVSRGASEEEDAGDEAAEEEAEGAEQDGGEEAEGESIEEIEEDQGVKKGAAARALRRLEPGDFLFVAGSARKGSGSFYTPRPLVRDLVHHALAPAVEGKTASEIERLRVLDPACGSAHFLVEAMRFLGQEVHRAYVKECGGKAPPHFRSTTGQPWDNDWGASDSEARASNSEARAWCKRRVAERCLFGVDVNPMAVELARVALWIESVAGDRPLTYFEHHIRCGNSLLGTWAARLETPPSPGLGRVKIEGQPRLFQHFVRAAVEEAARLRRSIDEARPEDLLREGVEPESVEEQDYKEYLRLQAWERLQAAKLLFDLRSASAFVPGIWAEWDTLCGLVEDGTKLKAYASGRPWWGEFEAIQQGERFFHWELEFPEVLVDPEETGFDAVLGNPPWNKVKPEKKDFYGHYDVMIRAFTGGELDRRIAELHQAGHGLEVEFRDYERRLKTLAACMKKGGDFQWQDWRINGRTTGGDPDVFKFFVERAWQLVRKGGRVGLVVPSALYNNEGCTGLRHLLLGQCQVERFYAFENRKKLVPIHSSYKFVSLVFCKEKPQADGFEAAFMRQDLSELEATARHRTPGREKVLRGPAPWVVPVRLRELEQLSPGTLAFLEYRGPRDREILLKMYGYDVEGNPVNPRPLLGDEGPGTWNARLYSEFHMTNDRGLWTDPRTGKLWNPRHILGPVPGTTERPPYYDPAAWPEIRARMADKGFWPLYEGKRIEQFLVDIKPIERWVSLEAAERKYGSLPQAGPKVVFRDIASNTNERTCVAAVLPERSCFGHTLSGMTGDVPLDKVVSLLNSFVFDFCLRFRTAGTHLSYTYMARMPLPGVPIEVAVHTFSAGAGLLQHCTGVTDAFAAIWSANRAVAEAYGFTAEDFGHILCAFPVFARKRPTFFAYLQERVAEWRAETGGVHYVAEQRVYAVPSAGSRSQVSGGQTARKAGHRAHAGYDRYNQAAVLALIVHTLGRRDLGRVAHDKMVYFVQEHLGVRLGLQFEREAAGPWDPALKHKVEPLAENQGWLRVSPGHGPHAASLLEPGPAIQQGLAQARKKLGPAAERVEGLCGLFNSLGFSTKDLERWATIHKCWKDLRSGRAAVSEDDLVYEILSWKGHRPSYSDAGIRRAIAAMKSRGLLVLEE